MVSFAHACVEDRVSKLKVFILVTPYVSGIKNDSSFDSRNEIEDFLLTSPEDYSLCFSLRFHLFPPHTVITVNAVARWWYVSSLLSI